MEEQTASRPRKARRKRRNPFLVILGLIGKLIFFVFTLCLIGVCTTAIFGYIFMQYAEKTIIPVVYVNADDYTMNQSSIIYYHDDEYPANGGWVEEQILHDTENRILVEFDQLPDALWEAAVAIEDHRFFEHQGVDWIRTVGAVKTIFTGDRVFGGSTITQQVLKNMTEDNKPYVNRKIREIFRALEFEKNYTKEQILELYLNTVYFGMSCYGVQTAAQYYFGKDVEDLSLAECASIIAITNNPSMYGPMYNIKINYKQRNGTVVVKTPRELNKMRQETILDRMASEDVVDPRTGKPFLTKAEAAAAKAETLHFVERTGTAAEIDLTGEDSENSQNTKKYWSWYVDQVFEDVANDLAAANNIEKSTAIKWIYNKGYRIYTAMDPKIQAIVDSVYEDRSSLDLTSRDGQPIRSAVTIMDPHTGYVVAIAGDLGEKTGNRVLSYARDRHQVGSSIKPLTCYSPALDAGAVTPATALDNYPVMMYNDTPWPKNSPAGYTGLTNIKTGVRKSINTIAVRTLQAVGVENSYRFATENLCLNLVPEDKDLSPLGMGGLTYGLSTIEMAAAYSAIANSGIYNSPKTYYRVEDAQGRIVLENTGDTHVAMKETTAYFMTDMLESAVESGTGTAAKFSGMHIAGKTGTTNDNYVRYFVGYTPYYVAAVWTGYKYAARINYSGNPAVDMWKKVMEPIHADLPDREFPEPAAGIETVTVCEDSGLLATDACRCDLRGSRVISVKVPSDSVPTESCNVHVFRDYCTAGHCLATADCPAESLTSIGVLNLDRDPLDGSVYADDESYTASALAAHGRMVTLEDGTEVWEDGGCPAHSFGDQSQEGEEEILDPNDPNYVPPVDPDSPETGTIVIDPNADPADPGNTWDPNYNPDPTDPTAPDNNTIVITTPGKTITIPLTPTTPSHPTTPTTPSTPATPPVTEPAPPPVSEPEPAAPSTPDSGGSSDDWWSSLWGDSA